jgi:putative ATPase
MKKLDYGKHYLYSHDYPGNFAHQEFMPEAVSGKKLYTPADNQTEEKLKSWLQQRWKDKYGYGV